MDVDGAPAPLMRANGLFRAVHLTRGQHVVTFTLPASRVLRRRGYLGGVTALALLLWTAVDHRLRWARTVVPNPTGAVSWRGWLLVAVGLAFFPSTVSSRRRAFSSCAISRSSSGRGTCGCGTPSLAGMLPWWDPHVAGGQSAIADALNQLRHAAHARDPPAAVGRRVVQPLGGAAAPVAAAGMFLFLRQRLTPAASALGASVFALAGSDHLDAEHAEPLVVGRAHAVGAVELSKREAGKRKEEDSGVVDCAPALQALCGEPVTWVATGLLAGAWVFAESRRRIVPVIYLVAGGLLASAQLIPTVLAGVRAQRAALATPDFWSLHPVSLWEAIAPNLFGNYYDAFLADLPWMGALNFGRDPFFYSLYVGPLVLLLASPDRRVVRATQADVLGHRRRRRHRRGDRRLSRRLSAGSASWCRR